MPPRTALNANLYTYQDAVERLQAFVGGAGLESTQLDLRQACLEAYDRVGRERDWEYLTGEYRLVLTNEISGRGSVAYTDSTANLLLSSAAADDLDDTGASIDEYPTSSGFVRITPTQTHNHAVGDYIQVTDNTAGTYTGLHKITAFSDDSPRKIKTDQTYSSDSAADIDWQIAYSPLMTDKFRVEIGNVACPIQTVTDSLNVVMDADVNFGQDVAATTGWKAYQTVYSLPDNFRALYNLEGERGSWVQHYITPYHWKNLERNYVSPGNVFKFTIMEDKDTYGNLAVYIHGFSNSVDTLDMIMIRYPRPLKYSGLDEDVDRAGTFTDASSTTITGVGTAYSADMVGSIFRWRDATNHPTGVAGRYPFTGQTVITGYTSPTVITVATAPGVGATATKYVITDPVDLHRDLYTSYQRAAEWMLGISRADTRVAMLNGNYREELNKALENGVKIIKKDPYLLYDFTSWEAATFAS